MARETDGQYVLSHLERRLDGPIGKPMMLPLERDFSIVDDERYFGKVATEIGLSGQPALPGLEEDPASRANKIRRGVNGARSRSGAGLLEEVSMATYAEDTCRSLFRATKSGVLIPVEEGDTVGSLTARTGDYLDEIYQVAEIERIPLSGFRRAKGVSELKERFQEGDRDTTLRLAVIAGNNNARKIDFWFGQVEKTTRGLSRISKDAVNAFMAYALSRPVEYDDKRNIIQRFADMRAKALEQQK